MSKRSKPLAFVVCALVVAITATTALAGHQTSGVKSYTGCLVSGDGVMIKIKEGESPRSACTGGQVQAHFSGGDITKISVGSGLSLPNGGDNGEVRIVLDASHSLPQNCTAGRVAEWNGSAWVCGVDNDTTYTAGTGLDLSAGDAFSIESAYRVKNTPDCSSGQFATGFDGDGDIQCAAPSAGSVQGYSATVGTVAVAGVTTVISKTIPAGTYLLFASVELKNQDGDSTSNGQCNIPGYQSGFFRLDEDAGFVPGSAESISLASAINHPGGAVALTCEEFSADVDVTQATLSAIKLSSLG